MSGQIPTSDNLWPLLNAACDGTLVETQVQELTILLDSDSAVRKVFLDHMQLRRNIRLLGRAKRVRDLGLARVHATLPQASPPGSPSPALGFLGNTFHGAIGYFSQEIPFALLIATVVIGLALLIGSWVTVSRDVEIARESVPTVVEPSAPEKTEHVGRITGMVGCKWVQSPESRVQSLALDSRLSSLVSLGDKFALASGLLEITYATGAKVILQGPCTYKAESKAGGFLSIGKLTAKLEKRGERRGERGDGENAKRETINDKLSVQRSAFSVQLSSNPQSLIPNPSSLFTINTPTATVTDLGTEFGVEVNKEGHTTSHVFRGSVEVQMVSADGKAEGNAQVLHENQSVRVEGSDRNRRMVRVPTSTPSNFVREIPKITIKTLDLVDVVAGGNGFSGRRDRGIDPTSGQATDAPPSPDKFFLLGDGKYHRVAELPLVDGVFIPAGGKPPVQVDSAGHTFADWVYPTANQTYGYIWAGGKIPSRPQDNLRTELNGIDYAVSGHGLIFLHANSGITFDLVAIRQANPDQKLVRFRAMTGNTESNSAKLSAAGADVWVLIDGQLRFRRREINGCTGVFSVAIPIAESDRFLTLASTDGNNGIDWDWIVFGDPRLELTPIPAAAGPQHPGRGGPDNKTQTQ